MWLNLLDYLIIILIIISLYRLIRKTEAFKISIGILIVYAFSFFASLMGLKMTSFILNLTTQTAIFALVLIFSSDLRLLFKRIGGFSAKRPTSASIKIIEDSLFSLAGKKHGALIILDEEGDIASASENLNKIDAKISPLLIETIFHPNTPLHDGALLIHKDRIDYAGCKLPLTARKRENFGTLGTRHMVAIETAENFDTVVFVVSEETGVIRIATKEGFSVIHNRDDFNVFFETYYEKKKIEQLEKKTSKSNKENN